MRQSGNGERRKESLAEEVGRVAGELAREEAEFLRSELRQLSGAGIALGASAVLVVFGMNLLTLAATGAIAERVPRNSSLTTLGAGLFSFGAAVGILGWGRAREAISHIRETAERDMRAVVHTLH